MSNDALWCTMPRDPSCDQQALICLPLLVAASQGTRPALRIPFQNIVQLVYAGGLLTFVSLFGRLYSSRVGGRLQKVEIQLGVIILLILAITEHYSSLILNKIVTILLFLRESGSQWSPQVIF